MKQSPNAFEVSPARDANIAPLSTPRLDLIPLTPAFLRASWQGNVHEAEKLLGLSLPTGWPDCRDVLELRLQQLESDPGLQPWLLRAVVLRRERIMVGHIGFHAAPGAEHLQSQSPGAAELGFEIFPPFQRRGYAREAATALMQWANSEHGVTHFILSIRPDNLASQALAAKLGFTRIGSHLDAVDGWEDVLQKIVGCDQDAGTRCNTPMKTKALRLVPLAPEHLRALVQGVEFYEQSFGFRPASGLREFIVSGDVSPEYLTRLQTTTTADPWTHGFALLHETDQIVIGMGGFKGPPDADGMVEIAYGVAPEYQGKGHATEAAQALVDYALRSGRVRVARAHTLPTSNASMRVLTKCGFHKVGEVVDPEDGLVWRWEKHLG